MYNKLNNKIYIVNYNNCSDCLQCIRECKYGAIDNKKGYVIIDYNKCIRCDYCKDNCPNKAIE